MTGLIGGLIASGLMALIFAAIKREARKAKSRTAAYFGKIAVAFLGGVAILSAALFAVVLYAGMLGNPTATWPMYAAFGGMALLAIGVFLDGLVRRMDWAETTIRFRKWNGTRVVAWTDVVSIEHKKSLQYTRVGFRDGSGFALSELMIGYNAFVRTATYRRVKNAKKDKRPKG